MRAKHMNPQELKSILSEGPEASEYSEIIKVAAGPALAPLTDLLPNEMEELDVLIKKLGAR